MATGPQDRSNETKPPSAPPAEGGELPEEAPQAGAIGAGQAPPSIETMLDPIGLIRHVAQLPNSLNEAWSAALDAPAVQLGLAEFEQRLSSLGPALGAHYRARDRQQEESGEPIALASMRPTDAELVHLVTVASQSERTANAQMVAFETAVSVLPSIRAPSIQRLLLPSGTTASFFDSGAFASLGAGLELLVRLLDEDEARGAVPGAGVPESLYLLECAGRALRSGLPDAALLYLRLALPSVHEALALAARGDQQIPPDDVPTGLAGDTAETTDGVPLVDDALIDVREAVAELIAIIDRYGSAQRPDTATALLLADGMLRRLTILVRARLFGLSG